MKRKIRLIIACILTSWTCHASAKLTAFENFDYSPGSINEKNGGNGFSGAWVSTTSEQVTSGNKLEISAATVSRPANFTKLKLSLNSTNYLSILINKGGSKGNSGENVTFSLAAGSGMVSGFSIASDERVRVLTRSSSVCSEYGAMPIAFNKTYLFVMKLVTSFSGADEFSVAWFKAGDSIPQNEADVHWLSVAYENNYSAAVDTVSIQSGSAITTIVDEFKLSSDYSDVISAL